MSYYYVTSNYQRDNGHTYPTYVKMTEGIRWLLTNGYEVKIRVVGK